MSDYTLDFELPLLEIEEKIDTLKSTGIKTGMDVSEGIKQLEVQLVEKRKNRGIFSYSYKDRINIIK